MIVVLVVELAVRAIEPALPPPAGWPDTATHTKVTQLERLARADCTDVVFVGNSMSRDDFVPEVFSRADPAGRTSYNASLDAASPVLLLRWTRDEVLPATDPATVVIGVASFDMNDAAATPAAALRSFDDAPYTAEGTIAGIEATFTRHLAIVRNRQSLRDPEAVRTALFDRLRGRHADRPGPQGLEGVIAADGHGLSRRELEFRGDAATVDRLRRQFLEPFEIGGQQLDALTELITVVESSGATAVLVVLPVTDAFGEAHPDGAEDIEAFRAALDRVVAGTGATIVEAPDLTTDHFADTHHLNGTGADRLSASLPALLREQGVEERACSRS